MKRTGLAALAVAGLLSAWPVTSACAQSPCAGLGGTLDDDQVCQVHTSTADYTIDISVPLDYPDQQAVVGTLTQERADFIDWFTKFGPDGRGRPYVFDITAQPFRSSSGTQSLVLWIENDSGLVNQGHPDTLFKTFNYDLDKHAPITFDTLFAPGTDPLAVLNPMVQREFGNHPGMPLHDLDAHSYRSFAITDDAVIFFFGQDDVLSDHNGPHQISIPRSRLAPLLAI